MTKHLVDFIRPASTPPGCCKKPGTAQSHAISISLLLKTLTPRSQRSAPHAQPASFQCPTKTMNDDEIAFRVAINVMRDSVESQRMPSGLPLQPDAIEVHARAADRLERLLSQSGREP
jgi:hypothetical protein